MNPSIHYLAAVILILVGFVAANTCNTNQLFTNNDIEIKCFKTEEDGFKLDIYCKTKRALFNLPSKKLDLLPELNVIFHQCAFYEGLNLRGIATSLGVEKIDFIKIFEGLNLNRENLRGLQAHVLELERFNLKELPSDLLHEAKIDRLYIKNLALEDVPKNFFKNSTTLLTLDITDNNITKLKRHYFANLGNLKELMLFNNSIVDIEAGTFDHLMNLTVLELSKNRLRTLAAGVFRNLVNLEKLNLGQNDLTELPGDLLRKNKQLTIFKMNYNRGTLASLPKGFFQNLKNLKNVWLVSNNFTSVPAGLFFGSNSLSMLHMNNNNLESLPEGLFESVNLESLYLSSNRITNLSSGVLLGLSDLKYLDISDNNLTYIEPEVAKYMNNLKTVDLSYNHLTLEIPNKPDFSIFVNCSNIEKLNVAYNEISRIFIDWAFNANLKDINLDGNKITYISVDNLSITKRNSVLYLRNNKISTVDLTNLEEKVRYYRDNEKFPENNSTVFLEGNPLNCDCKVLHFLRYLAGKSTDNLHTYVKIQVSEEGKCAAPPQFEGVLVTDVLPAEVKCLIKSNVSNDACNKTCSCWDYPGREVLSVDCSHRNLTSVPALIVNKNNRSIDLNMTGNELRVTPSLNRTDLLNVITLDLSNNNITEISLTVFSSSLHELELHNNKLSSLDPKVIDYLGKETVLKKLTLYNNKWICNCNARNFLSVVQKRQSTLEPHHEIICNESKRRLSNMTENELCEDMILISTGASLFLSFFGLVIGCLVALYYRYQKEIKVWLYSKQWCLWFVTEDELDKDKQYDAFISYSHKDKEFVNTEIVAKLEEGPKPYKLCLHDRDWLAGEWIPAQIARSIDESRRTIVILSLNFLESVWGRMEFRTAHSQALSEGRVRVILILYGDIGNTENLDEELQAYLSMNTYVKWGDPWFWDKLRYALPHRYESSRRRTRNAEIIEKHMSHLATNNHGDSDKSEIIPLPQISSPSSDSRKLLTSSAEDDRNVLI